jgi:ketosteroid isomerase-like protein
MFSRMMSLLAAVVLLGADAAQAQDQSGAKEAAQAVLTKGAALFDTRDASAMAATYLDDGELSIIAKSQTMGEYKAQTARGRSAIQAAYENLFKGRQPGTRSKNTVEFAHYVGPDLMVIHGRFDLDVDQPGGELPFVQIRVKQGDALAGAEHSGVRGGGVRAQEGERPPRRGQGTQRAMIRRTRRVAARPARRPETRLRRM